MYGMLTNRVILTYQMNYYRISGFFETFFFLFKLANILCKLEVMITDIFVGFAQLFELGQLVRE